VNALEQIEVPREWLSYGEARHLVGLSRSTLYRLMESGAVKGARVGRSTRINRASLEKFMEQQVISGDEG
jgi:excisionase family DNA binding protein